PVSAPIPIQNLPISERVVAANGWSGRHFRVATIIRPGVMFGPGDALFGTLANLARLLPVLPLIGGGSTRLQPVFVQDVAEAMVRILADPGTAGRVYELVGPKVYTLRDLV